MIYTTLKTLTPLQLRCTEWLIGHTRWGVEFKGGCLPLRVGGGKTFVAMAAMEHLLRRHPDSKFLIVCPSLPHKQQWKDEIAQNVPYLRVKIIGTSIKARREDFLTKADVYIIHYEQFRTCYDHLASIEWRMAIYDEAHKLANPDLITASGKKKKRAGQTLIAKDYTLAGLARSLKPEYKVALTGTPISNHPADLWGILSWLDSSTFDNYYKFTQKYCTFNPWGGVSGTRNERQLSESIHPYVMEITENPLPDLKVAPDIIVEFPLSEDEATLYEKVRLMLVTEIREEFSKVEHKTAIQNAFVKALRLQQLTASTELLGDMQLSSKTEALKKILDTPGKTLVYTRFATFADLLERDLQRFGVLKLSGKTKPEDRYKIVSLFNQDNYHQVLIITDAGSLGLNLHKQAHKQVLCEVPFSLGKKTQTLGRLQRFGQDKEVEVYYLLAKVNGRKSIDHHIKSISERKEKVAKRILSRREIEELLS